MHDTEMIEHLAFIDRSRCLWNQLRSPHVRIPFRRVVDRESQAQCIVRSWILVGCGSGDVFRCRSVPMYVPLVRTFLVRPAPAADCWDRVGGESSVPEDSSFSCWSVVIIIVN